MQHSTSSEVFWFEWERDTDGYQIEERPNLGAKILDPTTDPATKLIRARGGPREIMNIRDHQAIFKELAETRKTEAGVLQFANRYGLLGSPPRGERDRGLPDTLDDWRTSITVFRRMVAAGDAQDWPVLSHWFGEAQLGRMSAKLPYWHTRGPVLHVVPNTLRSAIYVQLAQAYAHARKLRKCDARGCGRWFAYGAGTGRRASAKYCSDACRKAAFLERTA